MDNGVLNGIFNRAILCSQNILALLVGEHDLGCPILDKVRLAADDFQAFHWFSVEDVVYSNDQLNASNFIE